MNDPTEDARRALQAQTNLEATERASLEERHGQVWDTSQLREDFKVHSFAAPFAVCTRLSTGEKGSLMFQHSPRFYFCFEPTGGE
jgi:hypothetical protein